VKRNVWRTLAGIAAALAIYAKPTYDYATEGLGRPTQTHNLQAVGALTIAGSAFLVYQLTALAWPTHDRKESGSRAGFLSLVAVLALFVFVNTLGDVQVRSATYFLLLGLSSDLFALSALWVLASDGSGTTFDRTSIAIIVVVESIVSVSGAARTGEIAATLAAAAVAVAACALAVSLWIAADRRSATRDQPAG
jgi:hypothetical protein